MNLTGSSSLISNVMSGLRNPTSLSDNDFKLIFLYPMLFDQNIQTINIQTITKDKNNLKDLIRSFLSITMLKEIYLSNTLMLFNKAGKYNTPTIVNSNSEKLLEPILRTKYDSYSWSPSIRPDEMQVKKELDLTIDPYQLQTKINQRTAYIKQLLVTDPTFLKFLPFVEIVSLENMIDVPVITGTVQYDVDPSVLTNILIGSIILKKPLDKIENVKFIVDSLKAKNNDLIKLYYASDEASKASQVSDNIFLKYIKRTGGKDANSKKEDLLMTSVPDNLSPFEKLRNEKNRLSSNNQKLSSRQESKFKELEAREIEKNMLSFIKNDLDQAFIFFKFMLDDELLYRRAGLRKSDNQVSAVIQKTSPQIDLALSKSEQGFYQFLAGPLVTFLTSVNNILYPRGINLVKPEFQFEIFRRKYIEQGLITSFSKFLGDNVRSNIEIGLQNIGESDESKYLKQFTDLANSFAPNLFNVSKEVSTLINNNTIKSVSYADVNPGDTLLWGQTDSEKEVNSFFKALKNMKSTLGPINLKISGILSRIFGANTETLITQLRENVIRENINGFLEEYKSVGYPSGTNKANYTFVVKEHLRNNNDFSRFVDQISDILVEYLLFGMQTLILTNLIDYINVYDIEIDIANKDALDLPNYSLVLPLETVIMLRHVYIKKNWNEILTGNPTGVGPPNESYIMNIVKLMSNQLKIPNIFIVDRKTGTVYYKMQYMINVQKIKIAAMNTFVTSNINRLLQQNQY